MMVEIVADILLFGAERGGLRRPVENGLRPSFSYQGELVACEVWVEELDGLVPLEQKLRARVQLPYGDALGWRFVGGESFSLNVASQVIGEGTVVG